MSSVTSPREWTKSEVGYEWIDKCWVKPAPKREIVGGDMNVVAFPKATDAG